MTNEDKGKQKEIARILGAQGGKATVKKYGKNYLQKLGEKAAEKRWKKKRK